MQALPISHNLYNFKNYFQALPTAAHEISENDYPTHKSSGGSLNIKRKKDGYIKPKTIT